MKNVDKATLVLAEKVMGWHSTEWDHRLYWFDKNGRKSTVSSWQPFEQIEHAKQVQDAMLQKEYTFGIRRYSELSARVYCFPRKEGHADESVRRGSFFVTGSDCPEAVAICLSALAWCEEDDLLQDLLGEYHMDEFNEGWSA